MKNFIDTNILYYKFANEKFKVEISSQNIVSINALEFLKNIEKKYTNRAKYHIPVKLSELYIQRLESESIHKIKRDHPFSKYSSDSIAFDFKQDFQSYTLYNNEAITYVLNSKMTEVFYASIDFLDKANYKEIKSKYQFLIKNELICESLDELDIELGYNLLDLFLQNYSIKEDFRNSWNDILILAKSINQGGKLITSDKLLNRFASEITHAKLFDKIDYIEIEFPQKEVGAPDAVKRLDSKGYINRGWFYKKIKGMRKNI